MNYYKIDTCIYVVKNFINVVCTLCLILLPRVPGPNSMFLAGPSFGRMKAFLSCCRFWCADSGMDLTQQ